MSVYILKKVKWNKKNVYYNINTLVYSFRLLSKRSKAKINYAKFIILCLGASL